MRSRESFGELKFIYKIITLFSALIRLVPPLLLNAVTSLIEHISVTVIAFWRLVRGTDAINHVAVLMWAFLLPFCFLDNLGDRRLVH